MMINPQWAELRQPTITLQEEMVECQWAFASFLEYFYTGKIEMDVWMAFPVLMLADKYNALDLVKSCLQFMSDRIVYAMASSILVSLYQYAECCGHRKLQSFLNTTKITGR
jgi:hypothetical protein